MQLEAGGLNLPASHLSLMGQTQLVKTYRSPNIIDSWTVRSRVTWGPAIVLLSDKPGSREENGFATSQGSFE